MKTSKVLALGVVLGSTLSFAGAARAGVTMVVKRGAGAAAAKSTITLDNDRVRVEGQGNGPREGNIIMDGRARKMVMINVSEKSYTELTEADMKKMGAQIAAMRAQAAEQMKNLPPEQRKKMEAMMGNMGTPDGKMPKVELKAMGQKKTVNGFACDMYRVSRDGVAKEEDCIAPWGPKVLQKSDFENFRKFAEEMAKSMGVTGTQNDMFQQYDKFPGIPVSRHMLDGGEDEEIESIKRGSVAESLFTVPAGYTKKEMPMMGGPGMGPGGRHHGGPPPKP
jgi:hypothetical protein